MSDIRLGGVVVATVMPFAEDGVIDWPSYRRLLDYCAARDGVASVFVNGHAGEGAALSAAERSRVITETIAHLGGRKPLLAGIIAYSTQEAIAEARSAKAAGADVAVLFPIPTMAAGGALTPKVPVAFVRAVLDAVDMPMSIFQYPIDSGLGYTSDTLVEIARLPRVLAIKEGSDTMAAYEDTWRRVKEAAPHVSVLPSNFDWFLAQMAVGADGILSGLASLTPDLLVDLWRAAEALDLAAMRRVSDRLYPIVRAIYGTPPRMDMHTRIKVALKHLGVIDCAAPRAPLLPVSDDVARRIARVVDAARLADRVYPGRQAAQ